LIIKPSTRFRSAIINDNYGLSIEYLSISFSKEGNITIFPWGVAGIERILECSEKFNSPHKLNPYFDTLEMNRVIVECRVAGEINIGNALNIVYVLTMIYINQIDIDK